MRTVITMGDFIKKDNPFGLDQTNYPNGERITSKFRLRLSSDKT